jgi:hypothetical protein
MSKNKGMTNDGISDTWLRKTEKWYLINNIWTRDSVAKLDQIFEARLVPLNKKYPDIPNHEDFRPIAILSHLYKYDSWKKFNRTCLNEWIKGKMDS